MSNLVRVIDNISGSVLFETIIEKIEDAYQFASLMEEQGVDVKIEAPGLAESLIESLGASEQEISEFKKSLDEEVLSHEDDLGCAICPPSKSTNH